VASPTLPIPTSTSIYDPTITPTASPEPTPDLPDPQPGWSWYYNQWHDFAVTYPDDWRQSGATFHAPETNSQIHVRVHDLPEGSDWLEWVRGKQQELIFTASVAPELVEVNATVLGRPAYFRSAEGGGASQIILVFPDGDRLIRFYFHSGILPREQEEMQVFRTMIENFVLGEVTGETSFPPLLRYVIEPDGRYENWHIYTNLIYGFSFSFPADWNVYTRDHSVWIRQGKQGLIIGVRWPDEDVQIQRTGVGAGELMSEGSIDFLGRELSRTVLVYEGNDKSVLYDSAVGIEVDGRIFTISLDYFDDPSLVLSQEVQATADEILESFELVEID
jgi:hypothetical protein